MAAEKWNVCAILKDGTQSLISVSGRQAWTRKTALKHARVWAHEEGGAVWIEPEFQCEPKIYV